MHVQLDRMKSGSKRHSVSPSATSMNPSPISVSSTETSVLRCQIVGEMVRAAAKRSATLGQLTMFQNAFTQSAFTFLYCR